MEQQLRTTLIGPMNVTRAVLPVMRNNDRATSSRSRRAPVSSASRSAPPTRPQVRPRRLDGVARPEVAPFGIHTTIVNPGFFRTELFTPESTNFAATSIDDYAERRAAQIDYWTSQNGKQSGDPAKLAEALVTVASEQPPWHRFLPGAIDRQPSRR